MIEKTFYGTTKNGEDVFAYTISNTSGASVEIITYGATLNKINVPDKDSKLDDILIGFDDITGHEERSDYEGKTVGRYANRIAGGKFTIDGTEYNITKNEKDKTCLHGGGELSNAVWKAIIIDDNAIEMTYTSADGANGFPGNVEFTVTFIFTERSELRILYKAATDKKTVINMTNHAYFNLGGALSGDVLGQELMINADCYTPTDEDSIPTGELRKVEGTAFDFRSSKAIGKDIGADDEQLIMCKGYDHNFCLNDGDGPAISAYDPATGRAMDVYTDLIGVQLYTANFLDGTLEGKGGKKLEKHCGFCLETQFYPDTPNHPDFPQCTVEAGKEWKSETMFRFYTK